MIKNILNLKGVKKLNTLEKSSINGGVDVDCSNVNHLCRALYGFDLDAHLGCLENNGCGIPFRDPWDMGDEMIMRSI